MTSDELLDPSIVLCHSCLEEDASRDLWSGFVDEENEATVYHRDVCAMGHCSQLQVRNHFCINHAMDVEITPDRGHESALRCCSMCLRNVKAIYDAQEQVWMLIKTCAVSSFSAEELAGRFHIEKRILPTIQDTTASETSPVRKRQRRKRRSTGKTKSQQEKEKQLAIDWSFGNIYHDKLFLWKDNGRRHQQQKLAEKEDVLESTSGNASTTDVPQEAFPFPILPRVPPRRTRRASQDYDENSELRNCSFPDCRRFAKTGDCCRFHAELPMHFYTPRRLEFRVHHAMI